MCVCVCVCVCVLFQKGKKNILFESVKWPNLYIFVNSRFRSRGGTLHKVPMVSSNSLSNSEFTVMCTYHI